jgi:hypothetical protein
LSRLARGFALLSVAAVGGRVAPLAAQESVFNLPGFGLPASGESVRGRGLGGAGMALTGDVFTLENPASLGHFRRAGLYLSLIGQQTHAEDRTETGEFDDVVFPMGQAVVPAWDAIVAVGYYQFVDFDAALETTLLFEGDTVPVSFDSEGGIGILGPSVAYPFDDRTSAGVSLDVYLGSREVIRRVETEDSSGNPTFTSDTLARDFSATGLTLGVERRFGEDVLVGASYRIRPTISSEITEASSGGLVGREAKFDLPDEVVLEAAARLSSTLHAAGVFRYSGWGGFSGEDPVEGDFGDAFDLGGGVEYAPESAVAYLLGPTAPLRLGFRWRRLPLEVDGERVREWSATSGYSRAFGDRSRVDVVVEYGRRGSVEANGLSERFLRLGVGIAVFEQWRQRGDDSP